MVVKISFLEVINKNNRIFLITIQRIVWPVENDWHAVQNLDQTIVFRPIVGRFDRGSWNLKSEIINMQTVTRL